MSEKALAFLWKNSETGQTRVVLADQVVTVDGSWEVVGPLVLGAAQAQQEPTDEQIKAEWDKLPPSFYGKGHWHALAFAKAVLALRGAA